MLTYNASRRNEQRQAFELLRSYNPWGKPGCGAPNAASMRRHNLMLDEIFPDRKLERQQFPEKTSLEKRRVRGRSGGRIRCRDTQLWFHPGARANVDNLLRWKMPIHDQISYRKCLDEIVNYKRRIQDEEARNNLEYERKLLLSHGPWGGKGPGGFPWRHPKDIGRGFHHSMGWTNENSFSFPQINSYNANNNCQCEARNKENLTDNSQSHLKQFFSSNITHDHYNNPNKINWNYELNKKNTLQNGSKKSPLQSHKIPCIFHSNTALENIKEYNNVNRKMDNSPNICNTVHNGNKLNDLKLDNNGIRRYSGNKPLNRKYSKVTGKVGRDDKKSVEVNEVLPRAFASSCGGFRTGGTPTRQLMELTGGVELVPLMRGRGRPPPPLIKPRWTSGDEEYLQDLTNQFKMQQNQREENISKAVKGCGHH